MILELTNLFKTSKDWTCAIDEGCGVDCLFLNFQKTFDTVSDQSFLTKLEACGVRVDINE